MTPDTGAGPSPKQKQLMELITEAFRGASAKPEREPGLFRWRHLEVMEKIGEGGFGEVYRAYDSQLRRDVALKLNRGNTGNRLAREGVMAEARRMARLRHPNILAVHGADEADDKMGIWFDLLRGDTLEEVCRRQGALDPGEVLRLAQPIASALGLIHDRGLVHGDVKPANIMVQEDGSPVLMDFGAATEPLRPQLQTAGSPLLMAPEQFSGSPASPASDQYALGATLYRLLIGRYPLSADSYEALATLHDSGPAIDLAGLPRAWRSLLAELLDRNPQRRPGAAQLEARLRHIAGAPQRRRRRAALALVIGSLLVATGVALTAARIQSQSQKRTEAVKNTLVEAIQSVSPLTSSSPGTIQTLYQNLQTLAEKRLEQFPQGQADMLLAAAQGLAGYGDTERAIAGARRGVALLEADPDTSLHSLATGYNMLGTVYNAAGEYEAAFDTAQKVLTMLEGQTFKTAADLRLVARNKVYFALDGLGRWREALNAQRELLQARQELFGSDSSRVAVDHHNLAVSLMQFGDFESALTHSRRAAAILAEHGEGASARMGIVLGAMTRAELGLGQAASAWETLGKARALLEPALGEDHWRVRNLDVHEARMNLELGERQQAVAQLTTLSGSDALSQADRFEVRKMLAADAMDQRQWQSATRHWDEALAVMPDSVRLLRPVIESARSYSAFRAGLVSEPPTGQISATLDKLQDQGLDQVWGADLLRAWVDVPLDQRHGRQPGP